jgi:hypothetical protein
LSETDCGFPRIIADPEMPRTTVRVFSSARWFSLGDGCGWFPVEIANLGVPSDAVASCERCGEALAAGDWPFCPHGRGKYSFRMR